jgi:4-amino-4-deoxy-L-arabinose transferase-like glycosyltransferase
MVHGGAAAMHTKSDPARAWHAGTTNNWERQQPPFYYTLLAPGRVLSRDWSIYSQLFLLRSISYLFAWSGLVIATFTLARGWAVSSIAPVQAVGPALWPALFPMWFPEMERLGNDSLVSLILALALVVTRKAILQRGKTFHFTLRGGICGLGLLTKATMLPFVAALGVFSTWRAWRGRNDISAFRASVSQLLVFCLVTTAVAGWWYIKKLVDYGDFIGSQTEIFT